MLVFKCNFFLQWVVLFAKFIFPWNCSCNVVNLLITTKINLWILSISRPYSNKTINPLPQERWMWNTSVFLVILFFFKSWAWISIFKSTNFSRWFFWLHKFSRCFHGSLSIAFICFHLSWNLRRSFFFPRIFQFKPVFSKQTVFVKKDYSSVNLSNRQSVNIFDKSHVLECSFCIYLKLLFLLYLCFVWMPFHF